MSATVNLNTQSEIMNYLGCKPKDLESSTKAIYKAVKAYAANHNWFKFEWSACKHDPVVSRKIEAWGRKFPSKTEDQLNEQTQKIVGAVNQLAHLRQDREHLELQKKDLKHFCDIIRAPQNADERNGTIDGLKKRVESWEVLRSELILNSELVNSISDIYADTSKSADEHNQKLKQLVAAVTIEMKSKLKQLKKEISQF